MHTFIRFLFFSLSLIILQIPVFGQQATPVPAPTPITLSPQPEPEQTLPTTELEFDEQVFDFGDIRQGEVVRHTFVFKNIGNVDAIIENVKPSCGCTKLKAPTAPIPAGESGEIEIEFNSAGKMGQQEKSVTIIYNGNPRFEQVYFSGNVIDSQSKDPAEK